MSLGTIPWKYPGVQGIDFYLDDNGDIIITKWNDAVGPQPTLPQLRTFQAQYAKHLEDNRFNEGRKREISEENLFEVLTAIIDKVAGEPGADAKFNALKDKMTAIRNRNPKPSL